MSNVVFILVVLAAALHATWNAFVKSGSNKTVAMGAVVLGQIPLALIILPFTAFPKIESLPYLFISSFLHFGYNLFLTEAYKKGALTFIYPISRGVAPLLVAAFSVVIMGKWLEQIEIFGIFLIGLGIISIGILNIKDDLPNKTALLFAFVTGLFIAAYSIVDGTGARLAGNAFVFYSLVAIFNGLAMLIYLTLKSTPNVEIFSKKNMTFGLIAGSASFIAYSLVIWAFTQASIGVVTALREVSIIFALIIGVAFLNEKLTYPKILAIIITVIGVIVLKMSNL